MLFDRKRETFYLTKASDFSTLKRVARARNSDELKGELDDLVDDANSVLGTSLHPELREKHYITVSVHRPLQSAVGNIETMRKLIALQDARYKEIDPELELCVEATSGWGLTNATLLGDFPRERARITEIPGARLLGKQGESELVAVPVLSLPHVGAWTLRATDTFDRDEMQIVWKWEPECCNGGEDKLGQVTFIFGRIHAFTGMLLGSKEVQLQ